MGIYIDVFILGVTLGWGPCLSFCAPILLPYIAGTQKNWLKGLKVSLSFSLARIVPYVILSLISASVGSYLIRRFYQSPQGLIVYIAAGLLIALLGIMVILGKAQLLSHCLPTKKIRAEGVREMAFLGLIVGFAPCAPLLGLLTYIAFNSPNPFHGASLGLTFGIGTLISPLIILGPLAGQTANFLLNKHLIYKIFSRACGVVLLYLGIRMLARSLAAL